MDYMQDSKYEKPCKVVLSLCDHSGTWSAPFAQIPDILVLRVDPKHASIDQQGYGYTVGEAGSGCVEQFGPREFGLGFTAGALAARMRDEGGYYLDNLLYPYYSELGYDCCEVWGVLIAAPCTDFASSGARWFKAKDADGRTAASVSIVRDCLEVVEHGQPDWWVLENPVGRIQKLVPELGDPLLRFDPADYAGWADHPDRESYTKRTALYGDFCPDLPKNEREPVWFYKTRRDGTVVRGSWMWAKLGGKSERTKELRSVTPTGFSRAFFAAQVAHYLC